MSSNHESCNVRKAAMICKKVKKLKKRTFKPSAIPGPRNDFDDVLLALSKLDLKTKGNPSLQKYKTRRYYSDIKKKKDHSFVHVLLRSISSSFAQVIPKTIKNGGGRKKKSMLGSDSLDCASHP